MTKLERAVLENVRVSGIALAATLLVACTASWAPSWVKDPSSADTNASVTCGPGFSPRFDGCEKVGGVRRAPSDAGAAVVDAGP